ncbi:hypothetical protein BJ138DRAFT_1145620 [Hygrophoropsis aurantiaca]|uniref:Uncharacterized protein n=1 Tax=Hygrophoropsis aurantiaca TaxID=72124 RepID=A0ACB8AL10_9AGAM|nr:hypothetical protein BJ138DRAFT_1145620 [Hygrophoropsis aurantiaca]
MSAEADCSVCHKKGTLRCSRCKIDLYCSKTCQRVHWRFHKHICVWQPSSHGALNYRQGLPPFADNVNGIIIHCNVERPSKGIFEPTIIEPTHKIYRKGFHASLFRTVGLPIIVHRHHPVNGPGGNARLDNQIATYLMIEPADGLADRQWQSCAGTVTVMRQDGKPLTAEAMQTMWEYAGNLLRSFNIGPSFAEHVSPTDFVNFCRRYQANMLAENPNHEGFKNMPVPL